MLFTQWRWWLDALSDVLATLVRAKGVPDWMAGTIGVAGEWVVYCAVLGVMVALGALGVEQLARFSGVARRWIWAASLLICGLVPIRFFFPAVLRPDRFLAHPRYRLEAARTSEKASTLPYFDGAFEHTDTVRVHTMEQIDTSQSVYFDEAVALGIREAPTGFHLAAPDYHVQVELGQSPGSERFGRRLLQLWLVGSLAALLVLLRNLLGSAVQFPGRRELVSGMSVLITETAGPAVVGILRPSIVLPRWALGLDVSDRRRMLMHEAEHIRAGDPYLLFGAALAVAIVPWHPALWWQLRRLRLAIEIDCDARVVRATGDSRRYRLLLVEAAKRSWPRPAWSMAASLAQPRWMLRARVRGLERRIRPLALAAMMLIATVALWANEYVPSVPPRWHRYQAALYPSDVTTRNSEFQLRTRTLTAKVLTEWSHTMPEVRAYLRREHPEVFACALRTRDWNLAITAAEGGKLLGISGEPSSWGEPRAGAFEVGSHNSPRPWSGGEQHFRDLLEIERPWPPVPQARVLRRMVGSGRGLTVPFMPCIRTFDYRIVSASTRPS